MTEEEPSIELRRESENHFRIRRDLIVHEDYQINHRISILLTTQSILFAAASVGLRNTYRVPSTEFKVRLLVTIFGVAGFFFGGVMLRALHAARYEQRLVRGQRNPRDKDGDVDKYKRNLPCIENLEKCLQASSSRTF